MHKLAAEQADSYARPGRLVKASGAAAEIETGAADGEEGEIPAATNAKANPVTRPSELLEAIFAHSRKGLAISRYKGLGEMNAEQLRETTLDPSHRPQLAGEAAHAAFTHAIIDRPMCGRCDQHRHSHRPN